MDRHEGAVSNWHAKREREREREKRQNRQNREREVDGLMKNVKKMCAHLVRLLLHIDNRLSWRANKASMVGSCYSSHGCFRQLVPRQRPLRNLTGLTCSAQSDHIRRNSPLWPIFKVFDNIPAGLFNILQKFNLGLLPTLILG